MLPPIFSIGYSGCPGDFFKQRSIPSLLSFDSTASTKRLLSELMPGRPVWGTATDDMHSMRHFAGDWVEFPMAGNSAEEVRQAMLDGAFYFASTSIHGGSEPSAERTPVLTSVRVAPETGHIALRAKESGRLLPDDAYVWVSMGEEVHTGPELPLEALDPRATYVRAEITGSGGTTHTQPFGLRVAER